MFTRIVVPVDGSKRSESVLPYVKLLASTYESEVSLLQALEFDKDSIPIEYIGQMAEIKANEARARIRTRAEAYLSGVVDSLDDIQAGHSTTFEDPVAMIFNATSGDFLNTLVAMSTHGRTGISRLIVGSVADRVVHVTSSPTLLVRPHIDENALEKEVWRKGEGFSIFMERPDLPSEDTRETAQVDTLIVPLDGTETAELSLGVGVDLAKRLGAGLLLIRVASSTMHMSMASEWPAGHADILSAVEDAAKIYLEQQVKDLKEKGLENVESLVLVGDAGANIVETASQKPNSMIVMTSRGRAGLGRAIMGSVADNVVTNSLSPVLLIRPS